MIRVYSLPDCISCTLTKRALDRRGVEWQEVPMTEEDVRVWKSKGALGAPIVDPGADVGPWWYGLRPDLIQEACNAIKRRALGRT